MLLHEERLNEINPYVKAKFIEAYNEIEKRHGYNILIVCGNRSLIEQGRLYRQGRTLTEINAKIEKLRNAGMDKFADKIIEAGPQNGKRVTNAAPGESIHNHGYAIDYVRMVNGECAWDDVEFYDNCSEIFKAYGFNCGHYWSEPHDSPHIEMTDGLRWHDLMAGKKPSWEVA